MVILFVSTNLNLNLQTKNKIVINFKLYRNLFCGIFLYDKSKKKVLLIVNKYDFSRRTKKIDVKDIAIY